jgi:hypothetical protein
MSMVTGPAGGGVMEVSVKSNKEKISIDLIFLMNGKGKFSSILQNGKTVWLSEIFLFPMMVYR